MPPKTPVWLATLVVFSDLHTPADAPGRELISTARLTAFSDPRGHRSLSNVAPNGWRTPAIDISGTPEEALRLERYLNALPLPANLGFAEFGFFAARGIHLKLKISAESPPYDPWNGKELQVSVDLIPSLPHLEVVQYLAAIEVAANVDEMVSTGKHVDTGFDLCRRYNLVVPDRIRDLYLACMRRLACGEVKTLDEAFKRTRVSRSQQRNMELRPQILAELISYLYEWPNTRIDMDLYGLVGRKFDISPSKCQYLYYAERDAGGPDIRVIKQLALADQRHRRGLRSKRG